jgi:hypothetical protein
MAPVCDFPRQGCQRKRLVHGLGTEILIVTPG